jgi:hypothetical protein
VNGLAVSRSSSGYVDMGWLYLGQDMGVSVWAGSIYVRIGECGYGQVVCRSGWECEGLGWLYLDKVMGVSV